MPLAPKYLWFSGLGASLCIQTLLSSKWRSQWNFQPHCSFTEIIISFAVPLQKIQMVNYAFIDYILISPWIAISIIFHNYYSLVHFPNLKIGLSAQLSQIYLKHLKKFTLIFSIFLWQLIIMRPQIIVVVLEAYIFLLQFSPNDWRNTSWY